jgi:hypothetical protein
MGQKGLFYAAAADINYMSWFYSHVTHLYIDSEQLYPSPHRVQHYTGPDVTPKLRRKAVITCCLIGHSAHLRTCNR